MRVSLGIPPRTRPPAPERAPVRAQEPTSNVSPLSSKPHPLDLSRASRSWSALTVGAAIAGSHIASRRIETECNKNMYLEYRRCGTYKLPVLRTQKALFP